jgi:shikimate kinase
MENIYLVGFMGTGKTCVGRELARRKKWHFIDLDNFIELKEKRTISDIFAKEGESHFRRLEKKALKEIAKEKKFIVACGGGIVINSENIEVMKDSGMIICLSATPEVIYKRVSLSLHRPLLKVKDPKKQIELLLKLRAPFYAQADKIVDTSKYSIKEIADKIIKIIAKKK